MKEKRVAIVGGGVSGLVIGNKLAKAPDRFSFRVFENRARFGGNIHTAAVETAHGSLVVEDGPDSWVAAKPETEVLARALKLDASIIEPKQRGVYLLQGDQFARMPDGLVLGIPTEIRAFLRSPTLSWGAKGRALMEPFVSKQKLYPFEDESVASFLRRRLGAAYTEELVAPLLGGVFAGNPEELSMRASFPQLLAAESASLVKTFRTARKARIAKDGRPPATFFSFKRGMQELIDALVAALPQTSLALSTEVQSIERTNEKGYPYVVRTSRGPYFADEIVLAGPLGKNGKLLETLDAPLAAQASSLMGTSNATCVVLAYERANVGHALDATGYIVPKPREDGVIAATFISSKWAGRAGDNVSLVRFFFGANAAELEEKELISRATKHAADLLQARNPFFEKVVRFIGASPIPRVGHLQRLSQLEESAKRVPGLHLTGAGFMGVGISDSIRSANRVSDVLWKVSTT